MPRVPDHTYQFLPERMQSPMMQWIEKGIEPGDFLKAIIENNLAGAVLRVNDMDTWALIPGIVLWLSHHAPSSCFGDEKFYATWCDVHAESRPTPLEEAINAVKNMTPDPANDT